MQRIPSWEFGRMGIIKIPSWEGQGWVFQVSGFKLQVAGLN